MSVRGGSSLGRYSYATMFALCFAIAISWLVLGGTAAVLRYWPGLLDGPTADRFPLLVTAAQATEPLSQLIVDELLSLIGITTAVVLVMMQTRNWSVRLLALALVSCAAVFNLQSHVIAPMVDETTGLPCSATRGVVLHTFACVVFVLALLLFPGPLTWWRVNGAAARGHVRLAAAAIFLIFAVGVAASLLPFPISSVLFFGFFIPAVGIMAIARMVLHGPSQVLRTQARLAFAVLVAALAANSVLGLSTLALWALGAPGLALEAEPADGPIALLFWSSRASAIAIAAIVLTAVLATRFWRVERVVGRGLAAVITIAVTGGVAVGAEALGWSLDLGGMLASLLAAAAAAVVFLPAYVAAEGITDRLLYGVRPTPYRALADIAGLGQIAATSGPDLEDIARAVGAALGAADCRLTVKRHALPDRTYRSAAAGGEEGRQMVSVPIRHGEEEIGELAVEYAAVGGLHADRRQLLEDIAGGLGGVVEAHRIGVELERQLRAVLAHGTEIARARRRTVSEMDAERRRIERDLHDGVQHHLVSLRLALGLVEFNVARGQIDDALQGLESLTDRLDTAEAVLAETVRGVQSILLVESGLVAAVEAVSTGAHPVEVESELPPGRRYPPETESTVYFCCLESINNTIKHAPGASIVVRFAESHGELRFTIADNGPGFSVRAQSESGAGRGLRNLRQRISGAGGRVEIRSAPGRGTTIVGTVPGMPQAPSPPPVPAPRHVPDKAPETDGQVTTVLRIVGPGDAPSLTGISIVTRPHGWQADGRTPAAPEEDLAADLSEERTEPFVDSPSGARAVVLPRRPLDHPPEPSLVADVRALIATARAELGPRADVGLIAVERGLDLPLRIGLLAAADAAELLRWVLPTGPPPGTEVVNAVGADINSFDALVVFENSAPGQPSPPRGMPTIVVVDDQPPLGPRTAAAARDAKMVLGVDWRTACAALRLTEADYAGLVVGRPVAALGPGGNRLGFALARDGRTLVELRDELVRRTGMPALREALARHVFARADVLRGRRGLSRLSAVLPRLAPGPAVEKLRYGLDRLSASHHEIVESTLLDDLHGGAPVLAGGDRVAALRLLGASGSSTTERLGLPDTAYPWDVEHAAGRELARWQRVAAQPTSPRQRRAATILIQVCERILARHAATVRRADLTRGTPSAEVGFTPFRPGPRRPTIQP